ncbi:hypothetical protein ACH427_23535 [Streptomyces sp. NPDC020379]|uniref:hypothetical protein n=1 Tax=Streptomyces sp. NPDC020379 TaxID=3365071 RepID=UPI0037BD21B5
MTARRLDRITRYDRRVVRVMNHPAGRPLRATAARRRVLVAAHIALTAAMPAVMLGGRPHGCRGCCWAAWSGLVRGTVTSAPLPVLLVVLVALWLMPLWTAGPMARDEAADDET